MARARSFMVLASATNEVAIEYFRAMDWDADAYVICLGTNDLVNKIDDDFLKVFKTINDEELFSDSIHPNKQGAELMAKILYPVIDLACRSVFIV